MTAELHAPDGANERPSRPFVLLSLELSELAHRVRAARDGMAAEFRPHGFRLGDVADRLEQAANELVVTATDVQRAADRPGTACPAMWGACPEHGATVASSAGRAWCSVPTCGRVWEYDRLGRSCSEPRTHRVRDEAGGVHELCAGHAFALAQTPDGGGRTVEPLPVPTWLITSGMRPIWHAVTEGTTPAGCPSGGPFTAGSFVHAGLPRCTACCRATGVAEGYGAPPAGS